MKTIIGKQRRGFTLVEMLVVVAIITVLAGLLFSALVQAKEWSRKRKAKAEVLELLQAWNSYWDTYPPGDSTVSFPMDSAKVGVLLGIDTTDNSNAVKLINLPPKAVTDGFKDPWKVQQYRVSRETATATRNEHFVLRVHLGNSERYLHE